VADGDTAESVKSEEWNPHSPNLNLKSQREPFKFLELLQKCLKMCGFLYHKVTSGQPGTNGKDGFKPKPKKTGVIFNIDPDKKV
jgi:hypothetical protein